MDTPTLVNNKQISQNVMRFLEDKHPLFQFSDVQIVKHSDPDFPGSYIEFMANVVSAERGEGVIVGDIDYPEGARIYWDR